MRQFVRCKYFSKKIKDLSFFLCSSLLSPSSRWTHRTCVSPSHPTHQCAFSVSRNDFDMRHEPFPCPFSFKDISSHCAYPFPMLVVFQAISTWQLAIRPDPNVLLHWKHKLMQCINCQDVDWRQRNVPRAMWNWLLFPIWMKNWNSDGKNKSYEILVLVESSQLFQTLTCVLVSRTSSMNDCARPPLKPSIHRIPSDVIDIFVMVQLCTWSGRPATDTCIQLICYCL